METMFEGFKRTAKQSFDMTDAMLKIASDAAAQAISIYRAPGNAARGAATPQPVARITGSKTGISGPASVVVDSHGNIYVAPPDQHMLLSTGHIHLSRGPKENRTRPAINPSPPPATASSRKPRLWC